MVPMAPSATMTRRDNCSRNSWARFGVFMGNGSQEPFQHGKCAISDSSSKAQAREQPALDGEAFQHPQAASWFDAAEGEALAAMCPIPTRPRILTTPPSFPPDWGDGKCAGLPLAK